MDKNLTFVNTQVPIETDIALRLHAAKLQISRSDVIRTAIQEYLQRHEGEVKVEVLPHPEDAQPVPVIYTQERAGRVIID